MIIGYDLDETLFPFMPPLIDFLKRNGITVPPYEETHSFDLWEVWGCTKEESFRRVHLFYDSPEFANLAPFPEGPRILKRLQACTRRQFSATSRSAHVRDITSRQVALNYDGLLDSVYHSQQYTLVHHGNERVTKGTICKDQGADLFVDDALHHAEEIASRGVPVLLLSRPWNRGKSVPSGVTRVSCLEDVAAYVEGLRS